jgi:predicted NBD/HSP70 family sugar kinase
MFEKATNNLQVRNTNKKRIINLLYNNSGMTKQNIASSLELSMPTVSQIMMELQATGLVRKVGTLESSGGRKPVLNALVFDAKFSMGINITRNTIQLVIIDLAGRVLHSLSVNENFEDSEEYFIKLGGLCANFVTGNRIDREKLLGVGISLPGIIRNDTGVLEYAPTLDVRGLPISTMTKYIPFPVMCGNEANLAGFAELWGLDQLSDAVFLLINKGVGGAIILNNKVFVGQNSRGGEFGHMTIIENGKTCSCGKKGCLEAYCSTRVLISYDYPDLPSFFKALETGNKKCAEIWDDYLNHLATGIINIKMNFDLDVIIGGDIDAYLNRYLDMLCGKVKNLDLFDDGCNYIHMSKFGKMAGSVGAALLLVDNFLDT